MVKKSSHATVPLKGRLPTVLVMFCNVKTQQIKLVRAIFLRTCPQPFKKG